MYKILAILSTVFLSVTLKIHLIYHLNILGYISKMDAQQNTMPDIEVFFGWLIENLFKPDE